jgi:acetyl-CoA carboxylase biotin carboxyl carrier protein
MRPKQIQELVRIVEKSAIDEIEVSRWLGQKIRIRKNIASHTVAVPTLEHSAPAAIAKPVAALDEPVRKETFESSKYVQILAPMVGTFYRAPSPDAEPFVNEGDTISKGQAICIIEAMKLMNEIESEISGRIAKILVDNAQPIEYNQVLFLIDPS